MAEEHDRRYGREDRYDPDGYLRARVDSLAEQIGMLREGITENLKDVKQEITRQETRFHGIVNETEKRTIERAEQINRTIVEQNTNIRDALREDRQQWIGANERMRTDFLQMATQLKQDNEANKRLIAVLQKYLWMFIGALTLLSVLSGFLKELIGKWLK